MEPKIQSNSANQSILQLPDIRRQAIGNQVLILVLITTDVNQELTSGMHITAWIVMKHHWNGNNNSKFESKVEYVFWPYFDIRQLPWRVFVQLPRQVSCTLHGVLAETQFILQGIRYVQGSFLWTRNSLKRWRWKMEGHWRNLNNAWRSGVGKDTRSTTWSWVKDHLWCSYMDSEDPSYTSGRTSRFLQRPTQYPFKAIISKPCFQGLRVRFAWIWLLCEASTCVLYGALARFARWFFLWVYPRVFLRISRQLGGQFSVPHDGGKPPRTHQRNCTTQLRWSYEQ